MGDVHGLDSVSAGNAASAMAVAMVAGAFIYGGLEKATGRAKPLVLWGAVATGLAFVALALWSTTAWVSIALFAFIGAAGFTYASIGRG